jgi:carbamoyltransferase
MIRWMNILGVNCFAHDTAAALLRDGRVTAFVEQERFNRQKHTKAFPDDAIEFCLRRGGIEIAEVDVVAFAHRAGLDYARGAADALRRFPRSAKRLAAQSYVDAMLWKKQHDFLRRWGYRGRVVNVGHHQAHAASAFFASGFDEAAVLTLDRGGDFLSTTLGMGSGSNLEMLAEVKNPDSLGEIYTAVTLWLGFHPNADEGKVMGLAPYGTDRYAPIFRRFVRPTHGGTFSVDLSWFRYHLEGRVPWSNQFEERFGPPRAPETPLEDHHRDVAFGVQSVTEETALHLARVLYAMTGATNLAMSGGVALNSVLNARVLVETPFERIFIQPAAGDAGNALGAALHVWHVLAGEPRSWAMDHAFLGPEYDTTALKDELSIRKLAFREVPDPAAAAAELLAASKIVGWFQGPAEVGPRALGARSILADPRLAEMKTIVNQQVKHREDFRPFAPSILADRGPEFLEGFHPNPFMLLVLPVRNEKRSVIPAVTHVDGTARFQSVDRRSNPLFHRLISEFERRTGVPVVLNTSFNLRGEPIVHRPAEALNDYLMTGMDALVMGPYVLEKAPLQAPA